jgi:cholesterol oxidase
MALWPNRGEHDPRPAIGAAYRPVTPVAPRNPVVAADAPAALRTSSNPGVERQNPMNLNTP